MYFWDIDGLKDELIYRTLAESTKFAYLFVYVIAMAFYMFEPGMAFGETSSGAGQVWVNILFTLIVIGGTLLAYIANDGSAGENFADRYFSLGFLSLIRVLAISMPIMVIVAAIPMDQGSRMNVFIAIGILTSIAQYVYLAINIRDVADTEFDG